MTLDMLTIIALGWGAVSGYLLLRMLDCTIGAALCLHGLLMSRWKRLVNKAAPGQISYDVILGQLFKVGILGLLFSYLVSTGTHQLYRKFDFSLHGQTGQLWLIAAALVALLLVRSSWRRLRIIWKITHQVDYAAKRQRTYLLRK